MAETQILGQVESSEDAPTVTPVSSETQYYAKVVTAASVKDVDNRMFYCVFLLLAIQVALILIMPAIFR